MNIIRYVLSIITVVFLSISYTSIVSAKELVASVDRSTVSITDTFTLTLKAEDIITLSQPDLAALADDFEVLSTNVSQSVGYVNGETSVSIIWRLQVKAKKLGKLNIPSIELSGEKSNVVAIVVTEEQITENDDANFTFELITDKTEVKINEQFIVTLRFTYSERVNSLNSSEFEIDNALVEKLEDRGYETRKNGRDVGVYEIRYAIFAKETGTLELPIQQVSVGLGRKSVFANRQSKKISMRSNALSIKVSTIENSQNKNILIADKFELSNTWSSTNTINLGDSITREISLKAEGVLSETIPPISMADIQDIKIYPEPANKKDTITDQGLVTQRTRNFAIVPTKVGEFLFPAIEVEWWNTRTKMFEKATLVEKTITVIMPKNDTSTSNIVKPKVDEVKKQPAKLVQKQENLPIEPKTLLEKVIVENPLNYWLIVLVCLLSVVITVLTIVIFRLNKKNDLQFKKTSMDNLIEQQSGNEHTLFKQLCSSIKQQNNNHIYRDFKLWKKSFTIHKEPQEKLRSNFLRIENQIYGNIKEQDNILEYTELMSLVKEYRKELKDGNKKKSSLAFELYPIAK